VSSLVRTASSLIGNSRAGDAETAAKIVDDRGESFSPAGEGDGCVHMVARSLSPRTETRCRRQSFSSAPMKLQVFTLTPPAELGIRLA